MESHPSPRQPAAAAVMVDVGAGHGAVVVWAPASLEGAEIEISPLAAPERRQHVGILPRELPRGRVPAAVFPSLPAGPHLLFDPAGGPPRPVMVTAARVTELTWAPSPIG